ncbi:MAG TPA: hypothetical protein VND62_03270 [Acidimicrobiales bacterium]|nr:hypothetical protein [Acidimicrobiales bacterium]
MTDGRRRGEDGKLAAIARTTASGPARQPRHARDPELTFGSVRRLDSGPSPDRHPAVHWPDDRRPHARRVENASSPVAGALRERLHDEPHVALGEGSSLPVVPERAAHDERVPAGAGVQPERAPTVRRVDDVRPKRDRVEANARLTGATAAVLLVLLAIEGFTLVQIHPLLNLHVFVGMLLIPPVLLKIGSTTWRFAKYYLGDPEYRRKGPPVALLRLLGPVVVLLTGLVLASGVALLFVSAGLRTTLLFVHKASFVLWFVVMTVHVLGHLLDTAKLAPRDWYWRTRRQITGASRRQWVLAAAVVLGLVIGAVTLPHAANWFVGSHHPVSGVHHR